MLRTRWLVIGFVVAAACIGGLINEHGPFADRPALAYPQFLADVRAGRVAEVTSWRDRLEVTESGRLLIVVVPPGTDLVADLANASEAGGGVRSWAGIPDAWIGGYTPWIPLLVLVAGSLIWGGALVRNRRAGTAGAASIALPHAG
jgi:hypothetical protein